MKKIHSYSLGILASLFCCILAACSDFEPTGMPSVPALAKAADLNAEVNGRKVNLSWVLPDDDNITGVKILTNGDNNSALVLPGRPTEHTLKGLSLGKEYLYTVKVMYEGGYVSEGISATAKMPDHLDGVKMAYLMTAADIASLPDDDERAAYMVCRSARR